MLSAVAEHLTCPITHTLLVDPVLAPDGVTYSRTALYTWLRANRTSPMTHQPLLPDVLRSFSPARFESACDAIAAPNLVVRALVEAVVCALGDDHEDIREWRAENIDAAIVAIDAAGVAEDTDAMRSRALRAARVATCASAHALARACSVIADAAPTPRAILAAGVGHDELMHLACRRIVDMVETKATAPREVGVALLGVLASATADRVMHLALRSRAGKQRNAVCELLRVAAAWPPVAMKLAYSCPASAWYADGAEATDQLADGVVAAVMHALPECARAEYVCGCGKVASARARSCALRAQLFGFALLRNGAWSDAEADGGALIRRLLERAVRGPRVLRENAAETLAHLATSSRMFVSSAFDSAEEHNVDAFALFIAAACENEGDVFTYNCARAYALVLRDAPLTARACGNLAHKRARSGAPWAEGVVSPARTFAILTVCGYAKAYLLAATDRACVWEVLSYALLHALATHIGPTFDVLTGMHDDGVFDELATDLTALMITAPQHQVLRDSAPFECVNALCSVVCEFSTISRERLDALCNALERTASTDSDDAPACAVMMSRLRSRKRPAPWDPEDA